MNNNYILDENIYDAFVNPIYNTASKSKKYDNKEEPLMQEYLKDCISEQF